MTVGRPGGEGGETMLLLRNWHGGAGETVGKVNTIHVENERSREVLESQMAKTHNCRRVRLLL